MFYNGLENIKLGYNNRNQNNEAKQKQDDLKIRSK